MRVLLSTIGSRGEVQPIAALAVQLRELGQEARVCAPPDFRGLIEGLGIPFVPLGPELRSTARSGSVPRPLPTLEQRRQMVEGTVAAQFKTVPAAAEGCDVLVAGMALTVATRSVAERQKVPYVYVTYCPTSLPSPFHAPTPLGLLGDKPADGTIDNRALWARDAERLNTTWGELLNAERATWGLPPVADVRSYLYTDRPWLAADPTLAPWPDPADTAVFQMGAWVLPDQRPLPGDLERFLDAGEPPVYFGFGSLRTPPNLAQVKIQTARKLGGRAVVSRGWADLSLIDDEPDCISVGEVNQQALFKRVAAAVHHGGAGTTTAAAGAGAPQVVIPQQFDQHYFARRAEDLGIGSAHASGAPTTDSLLAALSRALEPDVAVRARAVAAAVRTDGALTAARRLVTMG